MGQKHWLFSRLIFVFMPFFFGTCALLGCKEMHEESQISSTFFYSKNDVLLWRDPVLPVCWDDVAVPSGLGGNLLAIKSKIQQSVSEQVARSGIQASGWQPCKMGEKGVIIRLNRDPSADIGGLTIFNNFKSLGQILVYINILDVGNQPLTPALWHQIEKTGVHEFGHVLGLGHEHSRLDRDNTVNCAIADKEVLDQAYIAIGDFDAVSIMNYCYPQNRKPQFSDRDIATIRLLRQQGGTGQNSGRSPVAKFSNSLPRNIVDQTISLALNPDGISHYLLAYGSPEKINCADSSIYQNPRDVRSGITIDAKDIVNAKLKICILGGISQNNQIVWQKSEDYTSITIYRGAKKPRATIRSDAASPGISRLGVDIPNPPISTIQFLYKVLQSNDDSCQTSQNYRKGFFLKVGQEQYLFSVMKDQSDQPIFGTYCVVARFGGQLNQDFSQATMVKMEPPTGGPSSTGRLDSGPL